MKIPFQAALVLLCATAIVTGELTRAESKSHPAETAAPAGEAADVARPELLRISAKVDGSGKMVFTRQGVHYEHKSWARPENVFFDEEPWTDLTETPSVWREIAERLDLTKAWLVKREGRDVIALEHTPDGFDLYLCDAPNGSALYEVTIAIPRRP